MNITQKVIAVSILIVIIISTIMPTVKAVVEDVLSNGTEEQILYEQEENISSNESQNDFKNFDVLLAGFFTNEEGVSEKNIDLADVPSIILQKPEKSGIYIEENSRTYFLNLINSLSNKNYTVDENGFLVEDKLSLITKSTNSNYSFYTDKIDELITSEKTILISVDDTYCQYNDATDEILSILIEEDEYALLFKDSEEDNNSNDIIILNQFKYNEENTDNTSIYLMNKFLEIYYNEDDEFNKFINNSNYISNTDTTIENTENIIIDSSNTIEDNTNIMIDNSNIETNVEVNNANIDFNTVLSGILYDINNITIQDISDVNNIKPSNYGIWIAENSREIVLSYINTHSIYTYSIDDNGYLLCDRTMKNNPNLDFTDETILDVELSNILDQDVTMIISVASKYLTNENNGLIIKELEDTEFLKTFDNDNYDNRIVLLNSEFFNLNIKYDVALLDRFVKNIFKYENSISLYSDTSKTGNMVSAQTVYAGPSDTDFATVGSVDPNEKVYILGQSSGWYHIQYHVGSTGTQKSGFVPKSTVSNLNVDDSDIHEEAMTRWTKICKTNIIFAKL